MAGVLNGRPRRGEIWHYRFAPPDKQRPVVVLTRQRVLPLLRTAIPEGCRPKGSKVRAGASKRTVMNCDRT